MKRCLLVAALLVGGPTSLRAGEGGLAHGDSGRRGESEALVQLRIDVPPGALPFDRVELAEAMSVRSGLAAKRPDHAANIPVTVTVPEPGWVELVCGGHHRRVDLRAISGTDAARLVSMIIADLVGARLSGAESSVGPLAAADKDPIGAPPSSDLTAKSDRGSFAVAGMAHMELRTTDAGIGFGPGLEVQVPLGSHIRAALGLAVERVALTVSGPSREVMSPKTMSMTALPLRMGGGLTLRWIELRAGAVLRPYFYSGAASRSGVVWGAFFGATAAWPSRGSWGAFGVVGLDLYPQPVAFTIDGERVLSLRAIAPFVGVGAIWRGSRG